MMNFKSIFEWLKRKLKIKKRKTEEEEFNIDLYGE